MEICKLNDQNNDSTNGSTNEKMVSILVVDDDRTCLAIVARLLNGCNYQVLTAKDPFDALRILRTQVIKFDLIVSDVHMPELNGFELQRRIHQEFQLPVVLMSADKEASSLCEGSQSGASFFVVKPLSTEDLKAIWDFGNQWKKKLAKGKHIISDYGYVNYNEDDIVNKFYEKNSKRKLQIIGDNDHDGNKNIAMKGEALVTKKNKVVWTPNLHGNFIRALHQLGPARSVPRNILKVMNVPGLRRENIASHLQKFKEYQKKRSEAEHDPSLFYKLRNGKMWSSSFLSHEALLGYGKSKLLTDPGFPPSGLPNGTYPSQMYQPQTPQFPRGDKIFGGSVQNLAPIHINHNGFSKQIQPPNFYIGSGQEVHNTFVSQSNFASPTSEAVAPEKQHESADLSNIFLDGSIYKVPEHQYESADLSNVFLDGSTYDVAEKKHKSSDLSNVFLDGSTYSVPEQKYESADLSNIFFDESIYQSTEENKNQDYYVGNNFGDAYLPYADKVHSNLDEKKNGEEVNMAGSGSNNTTVDELVFWVDKEPSEKQENGGIGNSADITGTSDFELKGNQTSNDIQQGIDEDFWEYLLSDFPSMDNYF